MPTVNDDHQNNLRTTWEPGEQAELARRCGISRQWINDLIHGRANAHASPDLARTIEKEATKMGLALSRTDVLYPEESTNPLIKAI